MEINQSMAVIMPPPGARRERGFKHCFCLSVRPSRTYIANNSRTQKPSVPKFGMKVPHLWRDSHTSFKVKRSRSPGPLMLTHIVCDIFRTARPMNFKLRIWMEDDDLHQPQAPLPPSSKVRVARSHGQSEPSWPNALPVSLESGGGIPCWPNPTATLFIYTIYTPQLTHDI